LSPSVKAQWQIHLCVLLWGFTAILGKLISLAALPLVWWRMLLVASVLLFTRRFWALLQRTPGHRIAIYAGIGAIVALHWLTFYASIKLANASVAAACMGLLPMFTALIEPVFSRRRWNRAELGLGLATAPAVALVVGATPADMRWGVAIGVLSALLVAVFGLLNKRFVGEEDALAVTGLEMGAGMLFLGAVGVVGRFDVFVLPDARDFALLVGLALFCTLLPFALWLVALRQLTAFATALAVNLEPVYAIVLAMLLFGEQRELGIGFYLGVAIILASVFVHPWLVRHRARS
jgi:drug/metabolite transporter (DMT)-like permease